MKVTDETIRKGVRIQYVEWEDFEWKVYTNDRTEPEDWVVKVYCNTCGPEKFVPKVIEYGEYKLCCSCLTRMIEIINAATLDDCSKDRHDMAAIRQALKQQDPNEF